MNTETLLHKAESLPVGSDPGTRPISPRNHGLIDYAQSAMLITAPKLFGLTGTTATLTRAFGVIQLATNTLTDHPVAVRRLIPFHVHGLLEKWNGPAFAALALLTGGARRPQNLYFVVGQTLLAALIFNLTDWNGDPDE